MNFLKNYNAFKNLLTSNFKNLFLDFKKLVLLFFVVLLLIVSFFTYLNDEKNKPVVALVTEDNSIQMKLIIDNLQSSKRTNIFKIEKRQKKDLDNAVFVIDMGKDPIKRMQTNPPVLIKVDYLKKEPIANLIGSYIYTSIDFINFAQKSAMIYWDKLKTTNLDFDSRFNKLNELSMSIISSFLQRDNFIEIKDKQYDYMYFFISIIVFLVSIFVNFDIFYDIKKEIYSRLVISGIKSYTYILSRFVVSSLFSFLISFFIIYLYKKIGFDINFDYYKLFATAILMNIITSLVFFMYRYIPIFMIIFTLVFIYSNLYVALCCVTFVQILLFIFKEKRFIL